MPSSRYDPARIADYLGWLRKAADQIGANLGIGRGKRSR